MLLDSPIADDGLIRTGGREYGTSEYIARTFGKRERTIRRRELPRIKVGNPVLYDLARIPEWTPAGRAVLGRGMMSGLHGGHGTDCVGARDPFDPASLRLSQNPLAAAGVKKALIRVPVRRPSPQEFIRVHPGEDCRLIRRSSTCAMTAKPTDCRIARSGRGRQSALDGARKRSGRRVGG